MLIENIEALKVFLTALLSQMCEADPAALTNYVLALVKKDKAEADLKAFCLDQLEVFLLKETKNFVDLLFEALKTKSYLTNSDTAILLKQTKTASSPSSDNSVLKQKQLTNTEIDVKTDKKVKEEDNVEQSCTEKDQEENKIHFPSSPDKPFFPSRYKARDNEPKRYESDEDFFLTRKHSLRRNEKRNKSKKNVPEELYVRNSRHSPDRYRSRSNSPIDSRKKERESQLYSSHSRSRSKSKERCKDLEKRKTSQLDTSFCDHGDTDYRLNSSSTQRENTYISSAVNQVSLQTDILFRKGGRRCKDYDEKGYCMQGDLCLYDHGTDPLVVEDVSALNFEVQKKTASAASPEKANLESFSSPVENVPPPPSTPPPLPPPPPPSATPPPPPPPPSPGVFVPEPYNPEAPEMNIVGARGRDQPNYFLQPQSLIHSSPANVPHSISPTVFYNTNEAPSYSSSKVQKTRELVEVHTADDAHSFYKGFNEVKKENLEKGEMEFNPSKIATRSEVSESVLGKRKSFDYNRLGHHPHRKSLSKFNNDRCTLEIRKIPKAMNTIDKLNNHFCKFGTVVNLQIGYEGDLETSLVQFLKPHEANAAFRSTEAVFNNRFIKVFRHNKIGQAPLAPPQDNVPPKQSVNNNASETDIEQSVSKSVVFSTKGNLSRTIFNPTALKKNNIYKNSLRNPPKECFKEDKDSTNKRIELHKKKQVFLQSTVQYQKLILKKLDMSKNKKEKDFLKQTIQDIGQKISTLQTELKKDAEDLIKVLKGGGSRNKTEMKDLLDAELDLYNKQHTGDDISELLTKVYELKKKAKAMGLLTCPNNRNKNRGKKLSTVPYPLKSMSGSFSSRSIDHRVRKVLVSSTATKEDLQNYFSKFGEIESIDQDQESCIVAFKTRKDAEAVLSKGMKHEDFILSVAWHQEASTSSVKQDSTNVSPAIPEKNDQSELVAMEEEEDEDEEDCETRSWRH